VVNVTGRKGRGRPPKDEKRAHLNLRVSPQMREVLAALAERYGRSLTQQVELMLELEVRRIGASIQVWSESGREMTPDDVGAKLDRILAAFAAMRADVLELKLRRILEWQAEGGDVQFALDDLIRQAAELRDASRDSAVQITLDGLIRHAAEYRGARRDIDEAAVPTKSRQVRSKR
jgi:uncharacterized protein (DUF1778 family)